MRNELYARNGYVFRSDDLRDYFGAMPWYRPETSDRPRRSGRRMSDLERANVAGDQGRRGGALSSRQASTRTRYDRQRRRLADLAASQSRRDAPGRGRAPAPSAGMPSSRKVITARGR